MSGNFGPIYSRYYDNLYGDKDYRAECGILRRIFKTYASIPVVHILDMGCGTGQHGHLLARSHYQIIAVDRSMHMLNHARSRCAFEITTGKIRFLQADIRNLYIGKLFDAVIMMFNVIGYQTEDGDVREALRSARNHLHDGGLMIFDFWYGPAVMRQKPSARTKTVTAPDGDIVRRSHSVHDPDRSVCRVVYHLAAPSNRHTEEVHPIRYFSRSDIAAFLREAGFALLHIGAFPEIDTQADETTWNAIAIGKATA